MIVGTRKFAAVLAATLLSAAALQATAQTLSRPEPTVAYTLKLPDGKGATVYSNGVARIYAADRRAVETRVIAPAPKLAGDQNAAGLPPRAEVLATLAKDPPRPYTPGHVIVIYRTGTTSLVDRMSADRATLVALKLAGRKGTARVAAPAYTNDAATNRALAQMGVDSSARLFWGLSRSSLAAMHSSVASPSGRPALDFSNAYRLHLTNESVPRAVQTLAKLPSIAYVSPDWTVDGEHTSPIPLDRAAYAGAARRAQEFGGALAGSAASLPRNYASVSSLQSMLNAPSDDVMAAFDEIKRHFGQLPGQGEIVTNVSIGDLDDASAASNPSDPCHPWVASFGPTTEIVGGQRYLNLPSMPLIPAYASDSSGNLSGTAEVCGADPFLGEVDLDFSVMAPLPHDLQRAGDRGAGVSDLLGIAPGAQYRLVVPANPAATISDIDAAFLGAALQNPRPSVITASLGFGTDVAGFPSRYLEDDPMTEAIVASIVRSYDITVCIAAGDGTRLFTNAAIGPSGGSAATDTAANGTTPTNLNDVSLSTAPSADFDSGAIDVGGTTLDDLFAAPPQDARYAKLSSQHAFPETRWTGFTEFSSGFGSRVNVSAPSDNIVSFQHTAGGADDAVDVVLNGGTSASSPETAAAAAAVLQVARLTGHAFADPLQLRAFLAETGRVVPPVPQADVDLHIGPAIDLRSAIETLLARGGSHDRPSVARFAVEQRREIPYTDSFFVSDTNPANIDLQSSQCAPCGFQALDEYSWITLAPDWEFVPPSAHYALKVVTTGKVLATTPWARLQPETILNAAGLPLVSTSTRSVKLKYEASAGRVAASASVTLTFGPAPPKSDLVLAPIVPAVVRGATIPVTYDLSHAAHVSRPLLMVSEPGRIDNVTGSFFHPRYTTVLKEPKGTVQVPVAALDGGGIYGIGVYLDYGDVNLGEYDSDWAFTRVVPAQAAEARPAAPLLSSNGSPPAHFLEIPYGGTFSVSYDVSRVPGATGAELEISAPGPVDLHSQNTFNNPNGSLRDHNGADTGSIYFAPIGGKSGTVTLNGAAIGLDPAMTHVVRVIPMKFGEPAGEAGDVSTITMDGVLPADGGGIFLGYGVNANGFDGFLSSISGLATGQYVSSIETFDQTSNLVTQTVAANGPSTAAYGAVPTGNTGQSWGIYGSDVGLIGLTDLLSFKATYNVLDTVSTGKVGRAWSPPPPVAGPRAIWAAAWNQTSDTAAFLAREQTAQSHDRWSVFTSQLRTSVAGPIIDVTSPVTHYQTPDYFGFAEDTLRHRAIGLGGDSTVSCARPTIVSVDLANGSVDSFSGIGQGGVGIAVDAATNRAVSPTGCGNKLGIYDLGAKTGELFALPGPASDPVLGGIDPVADQRNHLVLVVELNSPEFPQNNNSTSAVLVYDEHGTLLKTVKGFYLQGVFLPGEGGILQVDPARRQAYLIGPNDAQLAPFGY